MPIVYLGNTSPSNVEGDTYQVTTIYANEPNRLANLNAIKSLWPYHAEKPAAWVECDDQRLAEDIADIFTDGTNICQIGRPDEWGAEEVIDSEATEEEEEEEEVDNG